MSFIKLRRSALNSALAALAVGTVTGGAMLSVPAAADSRPAATASPAGLGRDQIGDRAAYALLQLDTFGIDSPAYVFERAGVAGEVAARLGVDPVPMQDAWARADVFHQRALLGGLTQLGVPYRKGTNRPGQGFDCSGLTTFAWAHAGLSLTPQSAAQIRAASARSFETAEAGDLVYYPGHVSMWLGVGKAILHAPYTGRNIEVKIQGGNKSVRLGDPTG
jgi:hypothetical protein